MLVWAGVALVLIAALGAWLLVLGLRGRRIDDHPVCRKCRFDLLGVYPSVAVCPECGAKTDGECVVLIGRRRKRRAVVAVGVLMLIGALAAGGGLGWASSRNYDWNRVKPLWLLRREARGVEVSIAELAIRETTRRIQAGRVGRVAASGFITEALDNVTSKTRNRYGDWSTLFNAARVKGLATPEEYVRFVRQTVRPTVRFLARARASEPLQVRAGVEWESFGAFASAPRLRLLTRSVLVDLAGEIIEAAPEGGPGPHHGEETGGSSGGDASDGWPHYATLDHPPGEYTITARHVLDVDEEGSQEGSPPLVTLEATSTGALLIVAATGPVVQSVTNDSRRGAVAGSIECPGIRAGVYMGRRVANVQLRPGANRAPVPVFASVWMRVGEREWRMGTIEVRAPEWGWGTGGEIPTEPLPDPMPAMVEIVLRPNPERAEAQGVDTIWGEEIVFRNVAVTWVGETDDPMTIFARPEPRKP